MRSTPMIQSRRQFLRTFAFSAAAAMVSRNAVGAAVQSDTAARHMFLLGDWGALVVDPQQHVATAMAGYSRAQGIKASALTLLGDNFYGALDGGVLSPRWQSQ